MPYCKACGRELIGGGYCPYCGALTVQSFSNTRIEDPDDPAQESRMEERYGGTPAEKRSLYPISALGIISCALVAAGSFLPWIDHAASRVGGLDRDGKLTLALVSVIAILFLAAAVRSVRWPAAVALVLSLVATTVCIVDLLDILRTPTLSFSSVGVGLVLAGAGSVACVVFAAAAVST